MGNISYTKERFDTDIVSLIRQIKSEPIKYDKIIGISRGGCIPAVCLSHALGVPMIPLDYSATTGFRGYDTLSLVGCLQENCRNAKHVLIVDDLIDGGSTIKNILEVTDLFPDCGVDVAVLLYNTDITFPTKIYYGTAYSREVEKRYYDFWWEMYK